jgi:transposase
LPAEKPRIEHRHEPASCARGQCGANLVKIDEDVSEQLDGEPARFFVHRHTRSQYACPACENVTVAPVLSAVIDGGMATPRPAGLGRRQQVPDRLPLYRIEQIAAQGRAAGALGTGAVDRPHRRGFAAAGRLACLLPANTNPLRNRHA